MKWCLVWSATILIDSVEKSNKDRKDTSKDEQKKKIPKWPQNLILITGSAALN